MKIVKKCVICFPRFISTEVSVARGLHDWVEWTVDVCIIHYDMIQRSSVPFLGWSIALAMIVQRAECSEHPLSLTHMRQCVSRLICTQNVMPRWWRVPRTTYTNCRSNSLELHTFSNRTDKWALHMDGVQCNNVNCKKVKDKKYSQTIQSLDNSMHVPKWWWSSHPFG